MKGKIREIDTTSVLTRDLSDKSKYKKLEIPDFTGVNQKTWIYRVEYYFDINELANEEKVKVDIVNFG